MLIQYLDTTSKIIAVTAEEIADYIANIDDYIKVIVTINDCTNEYTQEYLNADIEDTYNKFYIADDVLYVNPSFLGLTAFIDSVLKITIRFQKEDGYIEISNCYFIDVEYKCKVAALLNSIIVENTTVTAEKTSTITHILHYALFNGSNCGCNCEQLCDVFAELKKIIDSINPQILANCGC